MIGKDALWTEIETCRVCSKREKEPNVKELDGLGENYVREKVRQGAIIGDLTQQHKLFRFYTPHSGATVQEFLPEVCLKFIWIEGKTVLWQGEPPDSKMRRQMQQLDYDDTRRWSKRQGISVNRYSSDRRAKETSQLKVNRKKNYKLSSRETGSQCGQHLPGKGEARV